MGLFDKVKKAAGGVPSELLENGLLGRGTIADLEETHFSVNDGEGANPTCIFTVQVALDHTEPFVAKCRQRVMASQLERLRPNQDFVAVRVNPDDHSEIALDLGTEPPIVTLPAAGPDDLTAVDILAKGSNARIAVEASAFLGLRNAQGIDMHTVKFTVTPDGKAPYVTQISNPVPAEAADLLKPGADLPAKVLADNDQAIAIDWAAAVEESKRG